MSLPKQVEEAAALAEGLHGKLFSTEGTTDPNEPPAEPVEPQDEPAAEPVVEPVVETVPDKKEDEETYKARYYTLKGMFDSEVPRLHRELKELKTSVFERLGEASKPAAPAEPDPIAEKINKYREEFGDELLEMSRLMAQAEIQQALKQSVDPVKQQVEEVNRAQVEVAQANFESYVDSKLEADWRSFAYGDDPKFQEFLNQHEPYGLYTYRDLLLAYNKDWNADGIVQLFQTYLGQNAPAPRPEPPKQQPNPAKEAMVAPSRTTPHTTPTPVDKQVWTGAMIKEFERNDRAGKYSEEESQRLWNDLLSAPGENRIRN